MTGNGTGTDTNEGSTVRTDAPSPDAPSPDARAAAPDGLRNPTPIRPSRPWVPAVVASTLAVSLLLFLMIPGVLRYPQFVEIPHPANPITPQARQNSNQSLEQRITDLRRLLANGVCVADGRFQSLPGAAPLAPADLAALPPPAANRTPVPEANGQPFRGSLLDLLDQSTVLVLQSEAGGRIVGSGTGFFVAPGKVLTNRHVTDGSPNHRLHVVSRSLGLTRADVLAQSPPGDPGQPDFALLNIDRANQGVPLALAPKVERLENIVAAGFPSLVLATDERFQRLLAGESTEVPTASVTEGVVTAVQQGSGTDIVLHTAQITRGNSGGPLVDRCGRVVGINTFILTREEGRMNYALASPDIVRFLTAHNVTPATASEPCTSAPTPSVQPPAPGQNPAIINPPPAAGTAPGTPPGHSGQPAAPGRPGSKQE